VIAAEHEGSFALVEGFDDGFGSSSADFGYLLEITSVLVPKCQGFGDFDEDIAAIRDLVTEGFEASLEASHTHSRRSHVDAAAAGAHVERDADDLDTPGR
jgi:hypothetical protein